VPKQDNSVNTPDRPAARGSVLQIFGAGVPLLSAAPVRVTIGGVDAMVQYAGPAPGAVAALFQVNAVVPDGVAPGTEVPLRFFVGGLPSQAGVTVAVK
jgi:uncharacterized protein (TIGR03437 family)